MGMRPLPLICQLYTSILSYIKNQTFCKRLGQTTRLCNHCPTILGLVLTLSLNLENSPTIGTRISTKNALSRAVRDNSSPPFRSVVQYENIVNKIVKFLSGFSFFIDTFTIVIFLTPNFFERPTHSVGRPFLWTHKLQLTHTLICILYLLAQVR